MDTLSADRLGDALANRPGSSKERDLVHGPLRNAADWSPEWRTWRPSEAYPTSQRIHLTSDGRPRELNAVFNEPRQQIAEGDNSCASPRGRGLVIKEDGDGEDVDGGTNGLRGLSLDGRCSRSPRTPHHSTSAPGEARSPRSSSRGAAADCSATCPDTPTRSRLRGRRVAFRSHHGGFAVFVGESAAARVSSNASEFDGVDLLPFLSGTAKGAPHDALYWRLRGMMVIPQRGLEAGEDARRPVGRRGPGDAHDDSDAGLYKALRKRSVRSDL